MLNAHYTQGIEQLEAFVAQFPGWQPLSPLDLELYESRFTAGWEVPGLCDDPSVHVRLLVGSGFPFSPPRIAVFPPPPILTWPNLEEHGILCLLDGGAATSTERIKSVAMELLGEARDLVNGWHTGAALERFEDEFQSYWNRWQQKTEKFVSLCSTEGGSRWVCSFPERNFTIVAEDEQTLMSWVQNYFTPDSKVTLQPIPLIRLPRPLRPKDFPRSVAHVFTLLKGDTAATQMLKDHLRSNPDQKKAVLLSFPGRRGAGFAGLILPCIQKKVKGFRKGHFPQHHNLSPVAGASVTRCDSSWVHGRDQNPSTAILGNKTVVLLGVGSLGSGVAEILAKIGVGKLVLVDPEEMSTENSCRHTLGVRSASKFKVAEQAFNLSKRFPHLQFVPHPARWEFCYQKNPAIFTSADLIVSTIGEWAAESSLNALTCSSTEFPPVLFGWMEEHAAAGHAVAFFGDKGCLRCMVDDMGRPRLPVTKWPDGGTQLMVPMCGGTFQPYGATELTFSQGVVADLAGDILLSQVDVSTHRVWIGQQKLLVHGKGKWHPDWVDNQGSPGNGGCILEISLTPDAGCPICGGTS